MQQMPSYLFHDPKNKEPLLWLIILSVFFILWSGGIIADILLWTGYELWCRANNEKLNNDPRIIAERMWWYNQYKIDEKYRQEHGGKNYWEK